MEEEIKKLGNQESDVYEAREIHKTLAMTWLKVYKNGQKIGWIMSWSLIDEAADIVKPGSKTYVTESAQELPKSSIKEDGVKEEEKGKKTRKETDDAITEWRKEMSREREVKVNLENDLAIMIVRAAIEELVGPRRAKRITQVLMKIGGGSALQIL